jgi:hypothetical protein
MGMDLKPVRPTKNAPRYPMNSSYEPERGKVIWGRYNWGGWGTLVDKLQSWGVSTEHFAGSNDGQLIPAIKCREVADAIEKHIDEFDDEERKYLKQDIELWRNCGGYKQY